MRIAGMMFVLLVTACLNSKAPTPFAPAAPPPAPATGAGRVSAVVEPAGVRAAPGPVTCGDNTCSGATPICCLSKGDHTCKAVKDCVSEPSTIPLGCTQMQDCPGQRCCLFTSPHGATYTTCAAASACPALSETAGALPMCKSDADCPPKAGAASLVNCGPVMYMEQPFCTYK